MYENYGDVNFFEHGILVDSEHTDTEYNMLRCEPYSDAEDLYQFAHLCVDVSDSWLDRDAVMSYAGMEEFDPLQFAIACTDYYPWDNFGASYYMVFRDWQRMNKKDILLELSIYPISFENLNPLEED